MSVDYGIDLDLAIFLGECCIQTYAQYENNGDFAVPEGYELVGSFKAEAIGQLEWFGYIIKSPEHVIIAFRGSHSHLDWIADAEVAQVPFPFLENAGKTHRGFTGIYSSCRDNILSQIESLPPSLPLYVTGHSLGAALSILAVLDIAANTHHKHAGMYNFGCPRVGNLRFVFNYDARVKKSIRIANIHDIAPNFPPFIVSLPLRNKWLLYKHVSREFPIFTQTGSILGNHDIRTYVDALKELQDSNLASAKGRPDTAVHL